MVNQELLSYIKASLNQGLSFEVIRTNLRTAGWTDIDIAEAINIVNNPNSPSLHTPPSVAFVSESVGPKKKSFKGVIIFFVIFIILLALGGATYLYFPQFIPFAKKAPYTEENFLSGLSFKIAQIKTLKYSAKIKMNIGPKELEVKPIPNIGVEEVPLGGEVTAFLPREFAVGLVAETDFSKEKSDWSINLDAIGDFFGTNYKFNMDALLKGEDYFFKVNSMPEIIPELSEQFEGIWYTFNFASLDKYVNDIITKTEAEGRQEEAQELRAQYSEYKTHIDQIESSYEDFPKKIVDNVTTMILNADEAKILKFKGDPQEIEGDGKTLYKYELTAERESFIDFVQKTTLDTVRKEIIKISENEEEGNLLIGEMTEFIESEDFRNIVGFFYDNGSISIIVDEKGFPYRMEQTFKILPSAGSKEQININYTIDISNINEPVEIEAPNEAKDIFEVVSKSLEVARANAINANTKTSMSNIRAYAELYYDSNAGYGKVLAKGSCSAPRTMFSSPEISNFIKELKNNTSEMACFSSKDTWAMTVKLIDTEEEKGYWCTDSTGASKSVPVIIVSTVCP